MKKNNGLKRGLIYIYALCVASHGMFFAMNQNYWSYFLTDISFVSAEHAGIILVFARGADIAMIFLCGYIIERSRFRWGKYRSWLLIAPPFACILISMMFHDPVLLASFKVAYFVVISLLATLAQDLMMNNLMTIVPSVAKTVRARDVLSAKRGQGSSFGKIIFGAIALPIILFINGGVENLERGYFFTALIFGIVMVFSFWGLFKLTSDNKELKLASPISSKQIDAKIPLKQMIIILWKSKPFLATVIADGSRYAAQTTMLGLSTYFFINKFGNIALVAVMVTIVNTTSFLMAVAAEYLVRWFGARQLYAMAMGLIIIALVCARIFGHVAFVYIAFCTLVYVGVGIMSSLNTSLFVEGVADSETKFSIEIKGFLLSMGMLSPKIGMLFSSVLIGFCLTSINYVGGVALSVDALNTLHNYINIIPALFVALGLFLFCKFPPIEQTAAEEEPREVNKQN